MSYKKTTLPDYLDTIILQDVGFYKENTNLMEVFENYLEELQFNIDYEESKSSGDFFSRVSQLYKKLNDEDFKLGNKQIDIINKNYYIEKYQSLFTKFKKSIEKLIDQGENIYFKNYSDDIGILIDSSCVMDTAISPFYDKFYEDQTTIPLSLPSTVFNNRCDMTAFKLRDKSINSCALRSSEKKLIIRSNAWLELFACKVAIAKCPVSAKAIPNSIVSLSRISPSRITSGA